MDVKGQKRQRIFFVIVVAVSSLALLFLIMSIYVSSQRITSDTANHLSETYLQEINTTITSNLENNADMRFGELQMIAGALALLDNPSDDDIIAFLTEQKAANGVEDLGFIDSLGGLLSANSAYRIVSTPEDVASIAAGGKQVFTGHELSDAGLALDSWAVYYLIPIDPIITPDHVFKAAVFRVSLESLERSLSNELGVARTSLISEDGTYIVFSGVYAKGAAGDNLFELLSSQASFDEGTNLQDLETAVKEQRPYEATVAFGEYHEYIYLTAIPGTHWTLSTVMPHSAIEESVEGMNGTFLRYSVILGIGIIATMAVFVALYVYASHRNKVLLQGEKAKAEKALEEARHAAMAKSEFLSRMSHEIRTPLNIINGMVNIAGSNAHNEEKITECLGKIGDSSNHLLMLVNDILDMSKIESGQMTVSPVRLDFKSFIRSVEASFLTQARACGLRFECTSEDVDEYIIGDILRLNQVLYNLLSNAFKFTEEGGSVVLRISEVRRGEMAFEGNTESDGPTAGEAGSNFLENGNAYAILRFEVIDTGCGIAKENLEKIFNSFEQEDPTVAQKHGGTGLGLSITKRLVEMMGGRISVESEMGEGSTFLVEVPLIERADEPSVPEEKEPIYPDAGGDVEREYDFSGRRVLIVEDNEINMEIIVELLETTMIEIDTAVNGAEALELFGNSTEGYYDLILMDVQMPLMDGYEATAAIRSLERSDAQTVQIFAMTANAFTEDQQRSIASGMDGHISKPLDIRDVYARISACFEDR